MEPSELDRWDTNGLKETSGTHDVTICAASGRDPLQCLLWLCSQFADRVVFVDELSSPSVSNYTDQDNIVIVTAENIPMCNRDDDSDDDHIYVFLATSHGITGRKYPINSFDLKEDTINILIKMMMDRDDVKFLKHFLKVFTDALHKLYSHVGVNCKNVLLYLLERDMGHNLIRYACENSRSQVLENMCELAKETFDSQIKDSDTNNLTPIMHAALSGSKTCFDKVFEASALNKVAKNDDNVLHFACRGGNLDIVKQVLTGFDVNLPGQLSRTPLMWAAAGGHEDVFVFLRNGGADMTLKDVNGDTVLHISCEGNNVSIVNTVYSENGINSKGRTPLLKAAYHGHLEVLNFLHAKQADICLIDKDNNSLIHLAAIGGNVGILAKLQTPYWNVNVKGMNGMSPIMIAAFKGNKEVFEFFKNSNADRSLTDSEGKCLLQLAIIGGNIDIVTEMKDDITCDYILGILSKYARENGREAIVITTTFQDELQMFLDAN